MMDIIKAKKKTTSILGWFNRIIFQWLFFRLGKTIDCETGRIVSWSILYPVYPMTGWGTDYKPLGFKSFKLFTIKTISSQVYDDNKI